MWYVKFDLNGDGEVGVEDFVIFNSSFGLTCECAPDFNGDGFVGAADFVEFNSAFGSSCSDIVDELQEGVTLLKPFKEWKVLLLNHSSES